MRALAWSRPAWRASSPARACAKSAGASLRRFHGRCSSHSIQSFDGAAAASALADRRRRSRAMAACTAGGSASAAPTPSTSRTVASVMTSGPRSPGGRRDTTWWQIAASFRFSSATPASRVWSRITRRMASVSKRTPPADAAVRHASPAPGGGAPADHRSNSWTDKSSRSTTTAGMPVAAAGSPIADSAGNSGSNHPAAMRAGSSNGRVNRWRSAMASFSCSV